MKRLWRIVVGITLLLGNVGTVYAEDFDLNSLINVMTREAGSGTRGAFVEIVGLEEKRADGSKKDLITEEAGVENNTNSVLTSVESDTYSIGYISFGSLKDTVKALKIEGIEATSENILNQSYPISRPFNIAVREDASEITKDFIDFTLSTQGQEIVSQNYTKVVTQTEDYSSVALEGKLIIGGSSSVAPLMEKLVEEYKKLQPKVSIELQVNDSTTGLIQTAEKVYDIGMSSRALKESEKEELTGTEIARDGIAIIVNKTNPLEELKLDEIKSIYLGESQTWQEVAK